MGYHKQLLHHNVNHMNLLLGNSPFQFVSNKQSLNGFFIDSLVDIKNIKTVNNSNHFSRLNKPK